MRLISLFVVLGLVAGTGVAQAATCVGEYDRDCVINNGLAPPNPGNVIDDTTYRDDIVYVRNVGCGTPDPWSPCPSPGGPTKVCVVSHLQSLQTMQTLKCRIVTLLYRPSTS